MIRAGGGEAEVTLVRKGGAPFHASVRSARVHGPDGEELGFVTTVRDISERKRHEDDLTQRAMSDGLTGLLNRRAFDERLRAEAARAVAEGRPLSVALLDLDHFKAVNDRHGHPAGDRVLVQTAACLRAVSRFGDHVARVGGEEFAWILPNTDAAAAIGAAERVRRAMAAVDFGDVGPATLSIGVCELAVAGDAGRLYELADVALYRAKAAGRDRCVLHRPL
jgi:diguanylate cyclase (GGDEF)-like protein